MKLIRCDRCRKRCRNPREWNVTLRAGWIVGITCPGCQTPMENAEAAVNEATLRYTGTDHLGRLTATPKDGAQ